jgi:hypothetical protein
MSTASPVASSAATRINPLRAPEWSYTGMSPRREWVFEMIRKHFRQYLDENANWQSPPANSKNPDPRVLAEVSLPFLLGSPADRALGIKCIQHPDVQKRLNACAFTTEYLLTVIFAAGDAFPQDLKEELRTAMRGKLTRYASRDLRHHGYNDNHVTLATSTLILGGQFTGDAEAIEEGRANLLNFRDTFLRRGFMHETNDCYMPHSIYPIAAVAEWCEDEEIRELALACEARMWVDWLGHWHVNLARKPGPSARDYTGGRLDPIGFNAGLWCILGERFGQPVLPIADIFLDEVPEDRQFGYNARRDDNTWMQGFLARICAHGYHIPEEIAALAYDRHYPHLIRGTHEVGNFMETAHIPGSDNKTPPPLKGIVPFAAREIYTYQYQEEDWAMGTASQRMIGNCPNNNWQIAYRKASPLTRKRDQGLIFCSYTINDKLCTEERHTFQLDPEDSRPQNPEDVVHWHDNGRYAAVQHEKTSIMLYRPRPHDRMHLKSLATSLIFPLCFGNTVEKILLGDQEIQDFTGESKDLCNVYIQDGPLYIGIRPLFPNRLPAETRVKAIRQPFWGVINFYNYQGDALNQEEKDLCRMGGGFLCEVADRKDFASLEDFKAWFEQGEIVDHQEFFMREVRYHRADLDLGLRWDVWGDNIMYRTLNGREYPTPKFECSGVEPSTVPWLTGPTSGMDHFRWSQRQTQRHLGWPDHPLILNPASVTA